MSGYRVTSSIVLTSGELEQEWCDLQERADCSFFQSWGWIGPWLKIVVVDLQPIAVRVWHGDALVGLGVFVHRSLSRHRLIRSDAWFLNEYPFNGRNMVIEYNGFLVDRSHILAVYTRVIHHLFSAMPELDELFFGGMDGAVDFDQILQGSGLLAQGVRPQLLEESQAWFVNLETIGDGVDAYLGTLSKKRRGQIRNSLNQYSMNGPLLLEEATDPGQAMEYFAGLKRLHTLRWKARGQPGVFANPLWEDFHQAVITAGFSQAAIQMLKVSNADTTIGYLYNLVWRRRVCVLQTGFQPVSDNKMMPGYVAHALAIAHNKRKGMAEYDLMHGESLYKDMLCNEVRKLRWVSVQRPRFRFGLENMARALMKVVRGRRG